MPSNHLDEILSRQNRTTNLQVVFMDIEKYSQRRTLTQIDVIDAFTVCLRNSLSEISKKYVNYSQENGINFKEDIITLPTGDGAAVVFTFNGLHSIHLDFAKTVLQQVFDHNSRHMCPKFAAQGWCNCHSSFFVRIGISEGKGVLYHDVNSRYNVAGNVINMAARVMGQADRSQIVFTEEAYRQIIDLIDDP